MEETMELMLSGMADAGCSGEEIERAKALLKSGDSQELIRLLKKCRMNLVDEMHDSQRKVDRMDFVIRQSERIL